LIVHQTRLVRLDGGMVRQIENHLRKVLKLLE
jgi:hypothetical protein